MLDEPATITLRAVPAARSVELARPEAGPHLHEHQAAVLLLLRDRRARARVRREHGARGRPEGLHDDRPAAAAARRTRRSTTSLPYTTDPAAAIVSVEPGNRRDPRDDGGRPATRRTSSTSPRSRRARPARRSRRSCSRRRSSRASTPTRPTTPRRRSRARRGPWCTRGGSRGRCTRTATRTPASMSVTRATLASDNTVYAQLTLDVGPALRVADGAPARRAPVAGQAGRVDRPRLARRLAARHGGGLRDVPGDGDLRQADGDHEGDAARRQGRHDSGWGKPQTKRALSQGVAWKVNDVLGQNALYGTGAGSGDGIHPNAGKTGTTENHADAWFDGYTRQLTTVVWMGYPKGEIPMLERARPGGRRRDVPGPDLARVHGGGALAPQGARLPAAGRLPDVALDHARPLREVRVHPDLRADADHPRPPRRRRRPPRRHRQARQTAHRRRPTRPRRRRQRRRRRRPSRPRHRRRR